VPSPAHLPLVEIVVDLDDKRYPYCRGDPHQIGEGSAALMAQSGRLASVVWQGGSKADLSKRSITTANRVAFVSLADRNDVDPALPAVEKAPRRRHATIGWPDRDGNGRANIASP